MRNIIRLCGGNKDGIVDSSWLDDRIVNSIILHYIKTTIKKNEEEENVFYHESYKIKNIMDKSENSSMTVKNVGYDIEAVAA